MLRVVILLIFLIYAMPVFPKSTEKLDVKSQSFMDLGRYVETLEINESDEPQENKEIEEDNTFEDEAILDVEKRYERNAVELNLYDTSDEALSDVNSDRVFKLKVNETQVKIENEIKAENMIWDGSKAFSNAFFTDTRQLAPIPGVVNSQELSAKISPSLSASLGQTYLNDSLGTSVLFVRTNESTYNTGSVVAYKGNALNFSLGSFSSSYNHAASGGAILSTNPLSLPKNTGSLSFGGAYFANEAQENNKITSGLFGEYKFKRLKLNAQVAQSKYSDDINYNTSLYFIPEYRISDSFYLKTRFIRNVSQNTMQDELVLSYKPIKSKRNLEIELNASNQYSDTSNIKQRLKLSTTFRI